VKKEANILLLLFVLQKEAKIILNGVRFAFISHVSEKNYAKKEQPTIVNSFFINPIKNVHKISSVNTNSGVEIWAQYERCIKKTYLLVFGLLCKLQLLHSWYAQTKNIW
jgi:hypothetical protein